VSSRFGDFGVCVGIFSSEMGTSSLIFKTCSSFVTSMLFGVIFPVSSFLRTDAFSFIFFPSSSWESPSFSRACRIFVW